MSKKSMNKSAAILSAMVDVWNQGKKETLSRTTLSKKYWKGKCTTMNTTIGIYETDLQIRNVLSASICKIIKNTSKDYTISIFTSEKDLTYTFIHKLDILFLSVELGEKNGIDLAANIRGINPHIRIILTSYDLKNVLNGYTVSAFRYLLKPFQNKDLEEAIQSALTNSDTGKHISIQCHHKEYNLNFDDIYYIESHHNKLILHLADEEIEFTSTLKEIQQKLNNKFFQIHKGYIVNLSKIQDHKRNEISLLNGCSLPISKYRVHEYERAYASFEH